VTKRIRLNAVCSIIVSMVRVVAYKTATTKTMRGMEREVDYGST
jgi:hypothetical protein